MKRSNFISKEVLPKNRLRLGIRGEIKNNHHDGPTGDLQLAINN